MCVRRLVIVTSGVMAGVVVILLLGVPVVMILLGGPVAVGGIAGGDTSFVDVNVALCPSCGSVAVPVKLLVIIITHRLVG
jgi:hypothetical protein